MTPWSQLINRTLIPLTLCTLFPGPRLAQSVLAFTPLPSTKPRTSQSRSVRLFSSKEISEEDITKWERMYNEGISTNPMRTEEEKVQNQRNYELRVISFDLDNTLWNTTETIAAANNALAAFLDQHDIVQPKRVEKVMGDLFKANKERYCPIDAENAKAPALLTLLRKDAIEKILREHNDYSEDDAVEFADKAFAEWTRARHDAIPSNLASSVYESFQEIASIRTSQGHPILLGAITDGNSDPRLIDELSEHFDFCINAETVGVCKPDRRVYMRAATEVLAHPSLQDMFEEPVEIVTEKQAEDMLGPWWVHIGDDFIKDVVAAKSVNMRSIWARELVLEKLIRDKLEQEGSTRTIEDLVKEVAEMKVVRMQVGADDYLVDSLQKEFADAIVDRFSDLTTVLLDWHTEGLGGGYAVEDALTLKESQKRESPATSDTDPKDDKIAEASTTTTRDQKFCLFCGEKLPIAAKFCSSCGERLPEIES